MKNLIASPTLAVTLGSLLLSIQPDFGQGTAFTLQGRLTDGGNPANGLYDFRSGPVATNIGGALVAGPLTNAAVMVSNGLFVLTLDYGPVFDGTPYWLQMGVRTNGGGTFIGLSPRPEVTPTPYAVFAISASNLSGTLPAAQLSGIIPSADLSGAYGNALNLNNAANTFAGSFSGNGASVTSLNANNLASGTVPDARLSANVALRAGGNALTGNQTITGGNVGIGTTSPKTALQVSGPNGTAIRVVGPAGGGSTVTYDLSTYDPGTNPPAAKILATDNGNYGNDLDLLTRIPGSATNALVSRLHISSTTGVISGNGGGLTNLNSNAFNGLAALWQTGGNNVSAGQFLGSTNNQSVELWTDGQRALRLEPDTSGNGSPNVIGGSPANAAVGSPALHGVTIAGGGSTNLSGYFANSASANYTTISGGLRNEGNGIGATVGGGEYNFANGQFATVPGGKVNTASGDFSFAAGNRAQALYQGDFVWADSQASDFISTANDQFLIRAAGGVGINTASPQQNLSVNSGMNIDQANTNSGIFNNGLSSGAGLSFGANSGEGIASQRIPDTNGFANLSRQYDLVFYTGFNNRITILNNGNVGIGTTEPFNLLTVGIGGAYCDGFTWNNGSDNNSKQDFVAVNPRDVLEKVQSLPITEWQYKVDSRGQRHLGPMAQDFHAAFGLNGADDKHIATVDEEGVALAAI